ncbi:MAG TPA: hypothetical protein VF406_07860 [Thermodesulfobacteriota bacterium]
MDKRAVMGFVAGFVAVLVFHQAMVGILYVLGVIGAPPYRLAPVPPFGVPSVINSAFWGGVWGIVFALVERRFPRGGGYWLAALVFGAVGPPLVAWFVVAPLKGLPAGPPAGARLLIAPLINGVFGVGIGLCLRVLRAGVSRRR